MAVFWAVPAEKKAGNKFLCKFSEIFFECAGPETVALPPFPALCNRENRSKYLHRGSHDILFLESPYTAADPEQAYR